MTFYGWPEWVLYAWLAWVCGWSAFLLVLAGQIGKARGQLDVVQDLMKDLEKRVQELKATSNLTGLMPYFPTKDTHRD